MNRPLVLVVDNDSAVSGLLCDVLGRFGLATRQVFDGEAALGAVRAPDVAVLVCDLDMPRVGGLAVLESMRDLPQPPRTVVVSGYLDAAIRGQLGLLPFVGEVFNKPFDLLVFAAAVRRLAGAGGAPEGLAGAPGEAAG